MGGMFVGYQVSSYGEGCFDSTKCDIGLGDEHVKVHTVASGALGVHMLEPHPWAAGHGVAQIRRTIRTRALDVSQDRCSDRSYGKGIYTVNGDLDPSRSGEKLSSDLFPRSHDLLGKFDIKLGDPAC